MRLQLILEDIRLYMKLFTIYTWLTGAESFKGLSADLGQKLGY